MILSKALIIADMHLVEGVIYENGTKRIVEEATLRMMFAKMQSLMHDLYISPASTLLNNQHARYHDALETLVEFVTLKPSLDALGIPYNMDVLE